MNDRDDKKQGTKRILIVLSTIIGGLIVISLIINLSTAEYRKNQPLREKYNKAISNYENGDYDEAIKLFEELGDFKDSEDYLVKIQEIKSEQEQEKKKKMESFIETAKEEYYNENYEKSLRYFEKYREHSELNREDKELYDVANLKMEFKNLKKSLDESIIYYEDGIYIYAWNELKYISKSLPKYDDTRIDKVEFDRLKSKTSKMIDKVDYKLKNLIYGFWVGNTGGATEKVEFYGGGSCVLYTVDGPVSARYKYKKGNLNINYSEYIYGDKYSVEYSGSLSGSSDLLILSGTMTEYFNNNRMGSFTFKWVKQ
jgi:tetratricopeptide (TPR) repeat protein